MKVHSFIDIPQKKWNINVPNNNDVVWPLNVLPQPLKPKLIMNGNSDSDRVCFDSTEGRALHWELKMVNEQKGQN